MGAFEAHMLGKAKEVGSSFRLVKFKLPRSAALGLREAFPLTHSSIDAPLRQLETPARALHSLPRAKAKCGSACSASLSYRLTLNLHGVAM